MKHHVARRIRCLPRSQHHGDVLQLPARGLNSAADADTVRIVVMLMFAWFSRWLSSIRMAVPSEFGVPLIPPDALPDVESPQREVARVVVAEIDAGSP